MPSWDLSAVLTGPQRSICIARILSLKAANQTGINQENCFGQQNVPGNWARLLSCCPETSAWLYVQGCYHFIDQVENLQVSPLKEADSDLSLLCPNRALLIYVDCIRNGKLLCSSLSVLMAGKREVPYANRGWPTGL